jgi:hypothetical protein
VIALHVKFRWDPSSGSRADKCEQAGGRASVTKLIRYSCDCANVPDKVVVMRKKKNTRGLMVMTNEPLELDVWTSSWICIINIRVTHTHTHTHRQRKFRDYTRDIRTSPPPPEQCLFTATFFFSLSKSCTKLASKASRGMSFNSAVMCRRINLTFWNHVSLRWIVTLSNWGWWVSWIIVVLGTLQLQCVIWIWHTHTHTHTHRLCSCLRICKLY